MYWFLSFCFSLIWLLWCWTKPGIPNARHQNTFSSINVGDEMWHFLCPSFQVSCRLSEHSTANLCSSRDPSAVQIHSWETWSLWGPHDLHETKTFRVLLFEKKFFDKETAHRPLLLVAWPTKNMALILPGFTYVLHCTLHPSSLLKHIPKSLQDCTLFNTSTTERTGHVTAVTCPVS